MRSPEFITSDGDELTVSADCVLRLVDGGRVTAGDASPECLAFVPGREGETMLRTRSSWRAWQRRVNGANVSDPTLVQPRALVAQPTEMRTRGVARGWCGLSVRGAKLALEFAPWTPSEIRRRYAAQVLGLVRSELPRSSSVKGEDAVIFADAEDALLGRDEAAKLLREFGFETRVEAVAIHTPPRSNRAMAAKLLPRKLRNALRAVQPRRLGASSSTRTERR